MSEKPWIRTCQECGHRQEAKRPDTYKGESWRELKCKKCKSPALDYGNDVEDDDSEEF